MDNDKYTSLEVGVRGTDGPSGFVVKANGGGFYGWTVDLDLCKRCGSVVADTEEHDRWHDTIEQH